MEKEVRLNKVLYKFGLYSIKIIPIIASVLYLLDAILSYFDIHFEIISIMCGFSVLPWLSMLLFSFILKFCIYHRLFLYYILVDELLSWYDYKIGFDISDANYLRFHLMIAGIFLLLIVYSKFKQ